MKTSKLIATTFAAIAIAGSHAYAAALMNPSFEDDGGSLADWTTSGQVSAWEIDETESATDGNYWATGEAIAETSDPNAVSTTLSQDFDLPATTQSFSVDLSRFKGGDDPDLASFEVKLYKAGDASGASDLVIWSDALEPSPYDTGLTDNLLSPLHRFVVDSGVLTDLLDETVTFSIFLGATPGDFHETTSGMKVDNLVVTIPEPATAALLGMLGLLCLAHRKRRAGVQRKSVSG